MIVYRPAEVKMPKYAASTGKKEMERQIHQMMRWDCSPCNCWGGWRAPQKSRLLLLQVHWCRCRRKEGRGEFRGEHGAVTSAGHQGNFPRQSGHQGSGAAPCAEDLSLGLVCPAGALPALLVCSPGHSPQSLALNEGFKAMPVLR